jgi:DNA-binding MarR family transcriptional regulator
MEKLLIEFINTLDLSLKKLQAEVGDASGVSKLTIHQFQYVDAINELGKPAITEIADKLHITKASVTTGVQKLINMGYVLKTQSSQDKRVFHVSLTEAGGQLIKAKYQALKVYGEFIESALSNAEARQFEATLDKLVKVFKQAD